MNGLDKIGVNDGESLWDGKEKVYYVATPHALSQVAGYLKFNNNDKGRVLFRGQNVLYDMMNPSLFRKPKSIKKGTWKLTQHTLTSRINSLRKFLKQDDVRKGFLNNTPEYTHEAILQQYGHKTQWLDLVDNIWIALWFAVHQAELAGKTDEYIYYKKNTNKYSYIILMQFGIENNVDKQPGLTETFEHFNIIDLRISAPSIYIRPHSQHGLLVKRKSHGCVDHANYSKYIAGTIKIKTKRALEWLGNGILSSTHFIFPPATYDDGYRRLIDNIPRGNNTIGTIQFIGP